MSIRVLCILFLGLALTAPAGAAVTPSKKTLKPFTNEKALLAYLEAIKAKAPEPTIMYESNAGAPMPAMESAPSKPTPAPAAAQANAVTVTKRAETDSASSETQSSKEDGITNVQTEGVDEGDIVKKRGDYLIILRRGRIFTVKVSKSALHTVSTINAYAPDVDPSGTWYDEMLISGNTVVVIGYSYQRGGTEIGLFHLNDQGVLSYRSTYHMRSNDYYSSRNYASRLIGNKLIFYTPLQLNAYADINSSMPAIRQWRKGAQNNQFKRILPATQIFRTDQELQSHNLSLHSVSVCTLLETSMNCRSNAVLGPSGRVFYVSEDSVYVWVSPRYGSGKKANQSAIYRMPLNGGAPTAIKASGSPVDQLSFLQEAGYLNVLVSAEAAGDAMWRAEGKAGDLAMLRINLNLFGDGTTATKANHYKGLPSLQDAWGMQNRFVSDWFIYGSSSDGSSRGHKAYAVRYRTADNAQKIPLSHDVQRIEVMGNDAIIVGSQKSDLKFTSVKLTQTAAPVSTYTQAQAAQGDHRTHGFFYRPIDESQGMVGLPILRNEAGREAAAILFLKNNRLKLNAMGQLSSKASSGIDDACKASCVDWYGNARPIFIGERAYALLGYELVEGRFVGNRIETVRRVNFSPNATPQIAN